MAGRVRGLLERLLARRREAAGEGIPDSELLRRFTRDRDEAAFELIVWRHGGMVLGLCRRAVRDEQLAEDAFQAVFLVLARKAGAVRGNLGGWLFRVARRVSARALKNRPALQPPVETAAAPTADSAERDELSALLDAEVARLPERLRRAVVLCYLGGHSTEDAARELGCPRGTVLSRLAAARKRLAERLTRRGVTLPATLATAGLSGRLVSSAAASAPRFLSGSFALSPATQLADGVIRTMSRATILTAMGGVLLAASLATGIGWVAAQQGANPGGAAAQPSPAGANPKADPLPKPPATAAPDPVAARREAEEKLKKMEQLAEKLRIEIESMEKQIEVIARVTNGDQDGLRLAVLKKQFEEVETESRQLNRELDKLDAEVTVLKKHLDDFPNDAIMSRRRAAAEIDIKIKKAIRDKLKEERDSLKKQLDANTGGAVNVLAMRQALEPQREMLAKVNRELVRLRVQSAGVTFTEATDADAKLDAILRELAALRKEVRELKEQRK